MTLFRAQGLVTCNARREIFEDAFLLTAGDRIVDLGPWKKRPRQSRRSIDYSYGVIMPGLLNLHSHLAMTAFRGLVEDVPLEVWHQEIIIPLEKKWISAPFVEVFTDLGLWESLRFGVTFRSEEHTSEIQ